MSMDGLPPGTGCNTGGKGTKWMMVVGGAGAPSRKPRKWPRGPETALWQVSATAQTRSGRFSESAWRFKIRAECPEGFC